MTEESEAVGGFTQPCGEGQRNPHTWLRRSERKALSGRRGRAFSSKGSESRSQLPAASLSAGLSSHRRFSLHQPLPVRCGKLWSSGWVQGRQHRSESDERDVRQQAPCDSSSRNWSQSSSGSSPKGSCCCPLPPSIPKASSTGFNRSREFDNRHPAATSNTRLDRYAIGSALR